MASGAATCRFISDNPSDCLSLKPTSVEAPAAPIMRSVSRRLSSRWALFFIVIVFPCLIEFVRERESRLDPRSRLLLASSAKRKAPLDFYSSQCIYFNAIP
jgi:hypothetical protein